MMGNEDYEKGFENESVGHVRKCYLKYKVEEEKAGRAISRNNLAVSVSSANLPSSECYSCDGYNIECLRHSGVDAREMGR